MLVGLNHAILAPMLMFGHGHSIRESRLFSFHGPLDRPHPGRPRRGLRDALAREPLARLRRVAPLVLIHRSLYVPALEEEARVDPKTGLFNARHFAAELREELARAQRFRRPMAVIMADLDLLRDINNTYGHLAGDAVLRGVADIFHQELRDYDVPARFGGEEFSVLLPETPPRRRSRSPSGSARGRGARVRRGDLEPADPRHDLIGVAAFPKDGADGNELIHQADLAVYRAKLQGRNRVLDASSEPWPSGGPQAALVAVPEDDGRSRRPLRPPSR